MIQDTQSQDQQITKRKSNKVKYGLISLALISVFVLVSYPSISMWYDGTPRVEQSKITTAKIQRGELTRNISVSGKIVAANAPQLYSAEQGKINLLAKPGETVELGQVVAEVSSPELKSLVEQQESTLEQLKIDNRRAELADLEAQLNLEQQMNAALSALNVANREYQRADISFTKNIVSEVDWLEKKDALGATKLAYTHAEKQVKLAEKRLQFEQQNRQFHVKKQELVLVELQRRLSELAIKAPVSGVVGNWLVAQKNQVAAHTAVMTIVDLSEYEAEIAVPEFYADDLGIGLPVSLTVAGQNLTAKIIAISPEIKANQVQVRAEISTNGAISLRQNQRVSAQIEFEKRLNALFVKRGSFIGTNEGKYLYKLTANNLAEKVMYTAGINNVEHLEILSGLQEGDEVIISEYDDFNGANQLYINE